MLGHLNTLSQLKGMFYIFQSSYLEPCRNVSYQTTNQRDSWIGQMASRTVCQPKVSIPEHRREPLPLANLARAETRKLCPSPVRVVPILSRNIDAKTRGARKVRWGQMNGSGMGDSDVGDLRHPGGVPQAWLLSRGARMHSGSSGAFDGWPLQYEGELHIILVKVPGLVKDLGGEVTI